MTMIDELAAMREARSRAVRSSVSRLDEAGQSSRSPAALAAMKRIIPQVAEAIRGYFKDCEAKDPRGQKSVAYGWLKLLRPEVAALIGSRAIMDRIAVSSSYSGLCQIIGSLLSEEAEVCRVTALDKDLDGKVSKIIRNRASFTRRRRLVKDLTGEFGADFPAKRENMQIGVIFIHLFEQATGLITIAKRHKDNAKKPMTILTVVPSDQFIQWMRDYHDQIPLLRPAYMPILVRPLPWSGATGGGLGLDAGAAGTLVKDCDPACALALDSGDASEVLAAANTIQDVAWRVNRTVFEAALHCWRTHRDAFAGLPARDPIPLPPWTDDIRDDKQRLSAWRRAAASIRTMNDVAKSRALATTKVFQVAEKFLPADQFFYPVHLDSRGRLYARTIFLQPQGNDLERGLLEFAEGDLVDTPDAERCLAIHGANTFGVDKVSFDDRVAWVRENEARILAVGDDPLTNLWWEEADKPFQFLAFCCDWWGYRQDGAGHRSRVPCAVDGSNNGLQLYSLLTGDRELALATNVIPSAKPQDIYARVAAKANSALRVIATEVTPEGAGVRWLLDNAYTDGLPRGAVKRAVMTYAYGVSRFSARKYVVDFIREDMAERGLRIPNGFDHYATLTALASCVWDSLTEFVVAAGACMRWIQGLAKECAAAKRCMTWVSPTGFRVVQKYFRPRTITVRTKMGDKIRALSMKAPTGVFCPRLMAAGSAPNFVHSLDASIMVFTTVACASAGINQLSMIHDSFATTARNLSELSSILRREAVRAFSFDPLEALRVEVSKTLGREVEPFGRVGSFDHSLILQSDYFFA